MAFKRSSVRSGSVPPPFALEPQSFGWRATFIPLGSVGSQRPSGAEGVPHSLLLRQGFGEYSACYYRYSCVRPDRATHCARHHDPIQPRVNRMPVILRPYDEERWPGGFRTTFRQGRSLVKPRPGGWTKHKAVHQSLTQRKTAGRSASELFPTAIFLAAGRWPCCKEN